MGKAKVRLVGLDNRVVMWVGQKEFRQAAGDWERWIIFLGGRDGQATQELKKKRTGINLREENNGQPGNSGKVNEDVKERKEEGMGRGRKKERCN